MLLADVGVVDDIILKNFDRTGCGRQVADSEIRCPIASHKCFFIGLQSYPSLTPLTLQLMCMFLLQATLSMDAKSGTKVGVTCTMGEDGEEQVLLCSLRQGGTESQSLDLIFDHYTEFRVQGDASVHLTGYYIPEYEEGRCPCYLIICFAKLTPIRTI